MDPARQSAIVPGVRKIAVLRANLLGDFIFALPALHALRQAYPTAEITLLGKSWHVELLANRPGPIDRVIAIPPVAGVGEESSGQEDLHELQSFFQRMQREAFDVAIQLHGGGRHSNPFLLGLGAKLAVGSKTPDASALDRWIPYITLQNEILRYLEVVTLLGATTTDLVPSLTVTERDRAEAWPVVPHHDQPLVALHPGCRTLTRRWPPEKFAAVGDALADAGAFVVVTGTRSERDLVDAVVQGMAHTALNLCDRLSIGGLAGLYSRCKLVVANDTGPLHLAGAVGAATVGIYWIGNVITAAPPTRTRHRLAISWRIHCPICGHECTTTQCEHRPSFVAEVPIEEVLQPALDLLALH
ncbi:MAG: glycosyltransferase family 9 protein [Herpetosiphonaceae bacterium]|nr:glycosyltransferase family 9 protein [Herpetosiphonaceae bacterium]